MKQDWKDELEPEIRREDRILAAKMSFNSEGQPYYPVKRRGADIRMMEYPEVETKHHYGVFRFIIAMMLFFAFIAAFHFDLSYKGWNQERVEQCLADDSKYQYVVKEVAKWMK